MIHEFGEPVLAVPGTAAGSRPAGGRHRAPESSWDVVDRVLGSWPITLRLAFLFLVLITGTAVLAAVVGVVGHLVLAGIAFRARRQHRRGLPELMTTEE